MKLANFTASQHYHQFPADEKLPRPFVDLLVQYGDADERYLGPLPLLKPGEHQGHLSDK